MDYITIIILCVMLLFPVAALAKGGGRGGGGRGGRSNYSRSHIQPDRPVTGGSGNFWFWMWLTKPTNKNAQCTQQAQQQYKDCKQVKP